MAAHRILLTGANGFVGTWLQRELAARARDAAIDVVPVGHGVPDGRTVDIADADAVTALLREVRPTAVVHLAAIAAPADARAAPRRAWDVNVGGTMNLAYAILAEAPAARFVFVSSSEVYGSSFNQEGGPLDESALLQPLNVYGATKAAADIMVGQMAQDGLKAFRFRPFNHTGPGQTDAYVAPAFARQLAEIAAGRREPVLQVGNLDAERDFLDVRDVVRAYADAALADAPSTAFGKAFNLSSGTARRIRTVLDMLIGLSGLDVEIRTDPARLRPSEVPSAHGAADAARATFGWQPRISLEQTLTDVLGDWKKRVAASNL